ncbi:MAG: hypothetical protein HFF90_02620 [Oscillibacter sp.]|nr:hypothetical protein [Oscillibacter sp.]
MMNGWTLFFIIIGLAAATAQLFRLVDLIEYPQRHPVWMAVWEARPQGRNGWKVFFSNLLEDVRWMFWRS